jgi:hypothetical protein
MEDQQLVELVALVFQTVSQDQHCIMRAEVVDLLGTVGQVALREMAEAVRAVITIKTDKTALLTLEAAAAVVDTTKVAP